MEKNKCFIYPEAIIINFYREDIILTSGDVGYWYGDTEGDDWVDED